MVTVRIAGEGEQQIEAHFHALADAEVGATGMTACPFLLALTVPGEVLRTASRRVSSTGDQNVGSRDGRGKAEVDDEKSKTSSHHEPVWISVSLQAAVSGASDERLLVASSVLVSPNGWSGPAGAGGGEAVDAPGECQREGVGGLKRILYLLHVHSLWQLLEMPKRIVTADSDVVTLVCPAPLPDDELHAYAQSEDEALHHPSFTRAASSDFSPTRGHPSNDAHTHLSTTLTHPAFGRRVKLHDRL